LEQVVDMTAGFTPADIQYLFQKVAQFAFEQEFASKQEGSNGDVYVIKLYKV